MFFPASRENLVGALSKAAGALSFCAVRHGFS